MKTNFVILLLIIVSCQNKESTSNRISRQDSFKSSLIGKWGGLNEDKPIWKITHDSIYYYEQNQSYLYSIVGNDLVIYLGKNHPSLKNISVNQDTLFFYLKANVEKDVYILTKAYRYK